MDLTNMSRTEKFQYLKANGVKCSATMKTKELDRLMKELDKHQRGEVEEKPEGKKSIRTDRKRVPLGRHRQRLSADHFNIPKDKVARWINDVPGRINQAKQGGYELLRNPEKETPGERTLTTGNLGDSVVAHVGQFDGKPLKAYLMVIDKDLYDEDQDFKQRQLDELDKAIVQGDVEPDAEGSQYVPQSGIKYDN